MTILKKRLTYTEICDNQMRKKKGRNRNQAEKIGMIFSIFIRF
jgi:hypothetical protein